MSRQYKILILTEEPKKFHILKEILKDSSVLSLAPCAYDSLAPIQTYVPDFIFVDSSLIKLKPLKVCEAIRQTPGLKSSQVIYFSPSSNEEDRALALSSGCNAYLIEPFSEENVLEKMSSLTIASPSANFRSGTHQAPSVPKNEKERLVALNSLKIMDTPNDPTLDQLVLKAAALCDAPLSCISFVDAKRMWIKASSGPVEIHSFDRKFALCSHTVTSDQPFIVNDLTQDSRVSANPFIKGENAIRFYAGIPLLTANGCAVGSLSVLDGQPRNLTQSQLDGLKAIARQVMEHLQTTSLTAVA